MENIERKIKKLEMEIQQDSNCLCNLDVEYNVVVNRYMSINNLEVAGKHLQEIKKKMDRVSKRIYKNNVKLNSLLEKYRMAR